MGEIKSLVEQRRVELLGKGIRDTIAKVEARLRMDSLAVDGIGADGRVGLRGVEANGLGADEIEVFKELVHGAHSAT